jgi:hypothetical protein
LIDINNSGIAATAEIIDAKPRHLILSQVSPLKIFSYRPIILEYQKIMKFTKFYTIDETVWLYKSGVILMLHLTGIGVSNVFTYTVGMSRGKF